MREMAVGQGFEPREVLTSTVFKTAALDRSASPPQNCFYILHGMWTEACEIIQAAMG